MKALNRAYLVFFLTVFVITISVNIKGTISTYNQFYHKDEAAIRLKNNWFYQKLRYLNAGPMPSILSYTGLDTGFGFFAPNVASEYITEFHVFDSDSLLVATQYFPTLKKESRLRLSSGYSDFQEYMEEAPDSMKLKKCDILLKGLSLQVLKEHKKAAYVNSSVYLYHYPLLSQLEAYPEMEPLLKPIKNETYTTDDFWQGY